MYILISLSFRYHPIVPLTSLRLSPGCQRPNVYEYNPRHNGREMSLPGHGKPDWQVTL